MPVPSGAVLGSVSPPLRPHQSGVLASCLPSGVSSLETHGAPMGAFAHGDAPSAITLCHPCPLPQATPTTVGRGSQRPGGGNEGSQGRGWCGSSILTAAPSFAAVGRKLSGKAGIDEVMAATVLTSLSTSPLVLGHPPATPAPGKSVPLSPPRHPRTCVPWQDLTFLLPRARR